MNLVVGDYFKVETIYVKHSKSACELISWLRSKTSVLARLRDIQTQSGTRPLSVIRAVLTRWTAHYLAFRRLLELRLPLRTLVTQDAMAPPALRILNTSGSSAANKKTLEMVAIIEDGAFWQSLVRYETFSSSSSFRPTYHFLIQPEDTSRASRESCKYCPGGVLSFGPDPSDFWLPYHVLSRHQDTGRGQYPWVYSNTRQHREAVGKGGPRRLCCGRHLESVCQNVSIFCSTSILDTSWRFISYETSIPSLLLSQRDR